MLGLDNPIHIAFVLIVLLLVFGAKRLPEMGKSMGEGLRGFKDSLTGDGAATHMHEDHSAHVAELTTVPAPVVPAPAPEPVPAAPERVAERTPASHAA